MEITTEQIKKLREKSGAGVMDSRNALIKSEGDFDKALEYLKQQSVFKVQKRAQRVAAQGIVATYIHAGDKIGALVELNCETDFVARTDTFKTLAHNIAMQIAAQEPLCISEDKIPKDTMDPPDVVCLLRQPFIKSPELSIQELINEAIAKTGENIKINRFVRFELGQLESKIAGV